VDYAGVIHLVNRQVETLFDYSREELVGQRIEMLVPARQPPEPQKQLRRRSGLS
jgi:PAS domain S-box-containing protein